MGQLRDTIRQMVRQEFAARLLREAEGEAVYRNSNYPVIWDKFQSGDKTSSPSDKATKNDFVRWFMKNYVKSAELAEILEPLTNDPDDFIEALNMNRQLAFEALPKVKQEQDPAAKIVDLYRILKKERQKFMKMDVDRFVKGEEDEEEKAIVPSEKGVEYDVDPDLEMKTVIADLVKTTKQTVGNRLKSATEKLSTVFTDHSRKEIADKAKLLDKAVQYGLKTFVGTFVEHAIDAFKGLPPDVSNEEATAALEKALASFARELKIDPSVVAKGTPDFEVFTVIFVKNNDEVKELTIEAANDPDSYEDNYDKIADAAMQVLSDEMNRQTNFDSLGIYLDDLPSIKRIRSDFGVDYGGKTGRPKGSTAAVVAARRGEMPDEEENEEEKELKIYMASQEQPEMPRRRGRPPGSKNKPKNI